MFWKVTPAFKEKGIDTVIQPLSLVCQIETKISHVFQQHPLCIVSERGPLGLLCGIQTNLNTKEFPYNTWKLTNVSIWRNQATNRPLSPDDIPDVRPWQPGLREAQRFCLTAVSPSLVLLRAGLTASYGGTPMDCVWVKRGKVGWANITTQCSPDKDSKMVILRNIKTR